MAQKNMKFFFSNEHQNRISTDIAHNPTTLTTTHGLSIKFIFKRKKFKSKKRRKSKTRSGDGNPLIYALKGQRNHTIRISEIKKIVPVFYSILKKAIENEQFDYVVPLPSSSPINYIISRRIQRTKPKTKLLLNVFAKKVMAEVAQDLRGLDFSSINLGESSTDLKKEVGKLLSICDSKPGSTFSMKLVNTQVREFLEICPLKLENGFHLPDKARVLLVDDLLASGSTMRSAHWLLQGLGNDLECSGICLFSPVRFAKIVSDT
ncbi:MAG: hypothetical protein AAGD09_01140 [Cyanobacteria bacterium P01_F01_bin.56]